MAPVRPAIDYTNKDYLSLRSAMLDLAQYSLPEWTDRSPSDPGVALVELMAYVGDICLYYIDRVASECFLATATERRSALNLLRLIGYDLAPALPAAADLTLTFKQPKPGDPTTATIASNTQFAAVPAGGGTPLIFEYTGPDMTIDLTKGLVAGGLAVQEGSTVVNETLGSSTGEPSQIFPLARNPVIAASVSVEVNDGASFKKWNRRDNLLSYTDADGRIKVADATSEDFQVTYDENGKASVVFGDGTYGKRPPVGANNIRATYRVGGGVAGNVAPNTIVKSLAQIPGLQSVTNPLPAAGGMDAESLNHAIQFAPLAFRSGGRAVTINDYIALAQKAGGVAKVKAVARGWNAIDLYVAPEGNTVAPVPEKTKQQIVAFFEDKRMVGTFVYIKDPSPAFINIAVSILVEHHYDPLAVKVQVQNAIQSLLAYQNVTFGKTIYLSKIYESVEAIPGVYAATVTEFRRPALMVAHPLINRRIPLQPPPMVAPDGRVQPGDFEIPVLGNLTVTVESVLP